MTFASIILILGSILLMVLALGTSELASEAEQKKYEQKARTMRVAALCFGALALLMAGAA